MRARWTMREFNELPHVSEARILASAADASAYIEQFPSPMVTLLARFVTFIVGAVAALLLALTLTNELLVAHFNLFFYLARASTLLAVSRPFTTPRIVTAHPEALLSSVATTQSKLGARATVKVPLPQ